MITGEGKSFLTLVYLCKFQEILTFSKRVAVVVAKTMNETKIIMHKSVCTYFSTLMRSTTTLKMYGSIYCYFCNFTISNPGK